jgi:hypothetical protein
MSTKRNATCFSIGTLPIVAEWTANIRGKVIVIHRLEIVGDEHHDILYITKDPILWELFAGYIEYHSENF